MFAKQGCADSFEKLVREYQLPLRAFLISKIGDATAADDLAQEVFLAAFQNIDSLKSNTSFRAWLFTVARNKAVDHLRFKSKSNEKALSKLEQLLVQPQIELFSLSDQIAIALQECLAKLQPRARSIVNSFYFENQTSEDIAAKYNAKSNTIRMSLMRVRKVLAKCIRERTGVDWNE
jgi:RNA polymerase sigma-70 factor (ECF subfamily)